MLLKNKHRAVYSRAVHGNVIAIIDKSVDQHLNGFVVFPLAAQTVRATTDDGKRVLLLPDGTWRLEAPPKPAAITAPHRLVPNTSMRKIIARRLTESKQQVPSLTTLAVNSSPRR